MKLCLVIWGMTIVLSSCFLLYVTYAGSFLQYLFVLLHILVYVLCVALWLYDWRCSTELSKSHCHKLDVLPNFSGFAVNISKGRIPKIVRILYIQHLLLTETKNNFLMWHMMQQIFWFLYISGKQNGQSRVFGFLFTLRNVTLIGLILPFHIQRVP